MQQNMKALMFKILLIIMSVLVSSLFLYKILNMRTVSSPEVVVLQIPSELRQVSVSESLNQQS